jgi:hydrogenase expression/formation protein HypC
MCLAIPAKIESIQGERATVSLGEARSEAVITLTPQAKVGDYVLVHAGYAIAVVEEADARETFAILRQIQDLAPE